MSSPAKTYESHMVPSFFAPWASHLVRIANPQPGDFVLDVGCGTGILARQVAPHVGSSGKVIGLDLSPDMLTVAQAAGDRENLIIEWHEGRAEKLPFSESHFDLVLSQFALMFFADRPTALAEMHRVLKNDGRLYLSVFQSIDHHPFYQTLDKVIQQRLGMSGVQDIFSLGDAGELHRLLSDAGFQGISIEQVSMTARFPDPQGFLAGEIDVDTAAIPSMQHLNAQARQAITTSIRDYMKEPLHQVTEDNHVVIPFHVHIAHAQR